MATRNITVVTTAPSTTPSAATINIKFSHNATPVRVGFSGKNFKVSRANPGKIR